MSRQVIHGFEGEPEAYFVMVPEGTEFDPTEGDAAEAVRRFRQDPRPVKPGVIRGYTLPSGRLATVTSIGNSPDYDRATLHRSTVMGIRDLLASSVTKLQICGGGPGDAETAGREVGLAAGLAAFEVRSFRAAEESGPALAIRSPKAEFHQGLAEGLALAASVNLTRELVNTPPNIATPEALAVRAEELAKDHGLGIEIWREEKLTEERMTGLLTVGRASAHGPRFVRLSYVPREGDAQAKPVVLVGKGITFDTGGYSLKSRDGMRGMKYDKSGAMAVIGAMHAVATVIRPPFPVVGLLCLAENAVSGEGFRPDDIITYRNGTTVEITNTDAEGRLVLADGLIWAAEKENPAVVLNIATLTGACVTALGNLYAGVWSRHRDLVNELMAVGEQSGDALWPLPLHPVFREKMESEVADMVNSDLKAAGGSNKAAAFLADFVPESVPWAHIDMAGTSDTNGTTGLPDGPSGYGVRLFAEFIAGRIAR